MIPKPSIVAILVILFFLIPKYIYDRYPQYSDLMFSIILVGLPIVLITHGIMAIKTKKVIISSRGGASEEHTGKSAQYWGVLFIFIGVLAGGLLLFIWWGRPKSEIITLPK